MAGDEGHDPILKPLEVVVGLGGGDDRAAHADRVDGHGGAGDGKAPSGSHCQRHADGMASSQDDGDRRLCHAGDQLRDGKARLHVAAHGIQQEEDAVHLVALLQLGQQGQHMLVLGGLGTAGGGVVALDLADDGHAVHGAVGCFGQGGAEVHDLLGAVLSALIIFLCGVRRFGAFCHGKPSFSPVFSAIL